MRSPPFCNKNSVFVIHALSLNAVIYTLLLLKNGLVSSPSGDGRTLTLLLVLRSPMSVSRVYADVISQMPEGYADYDTVEINWQYVVLRSPLTPLDPRSAIRSSRRWAEASIAKCLRRST